MSLVVGAGQAQVAGEFVFVVVQLQAVTQRRHAWHVAAVDEFAAGVVAEQSQFQQTQMVFQHREDQLGFVAFENRILLTALQHRYAVLGVAVVAGAFFVEKFAGAALVNVIAGPVMEQVQFGAQPVGFEAVAQIEVVGGFLFQRGVAALPAAGGVVEAVG